eukprot:428773_1
MNAPAFAKVCKDVTTRMVDNGFKNYTLKQNSVDFGGEMIQACPHRETKGQITITCSEEELEDESIASARDLLGHISGANTRTLDMVNSRTYFYFTLSFARTDRLVEIRRILIAPSGVGGGGGVTCYQFRDTGSCEFGQDCCFSHEGGGGGGGG